MAQGATPDVMRMPWHWNSLEEYATAPGIACFNRSPEYAHGGLSIQECLIPDILVARGEDDAAAATITSITWRGLRCFVAADPGGTAVTADLRLGSPSGESVVAVPKHVDPDGSVSLVLSADADESDALVLVLVNDAGIILAHQATKVGEGYMTTTSVELDPLDRVAAKAFPGYLVRKDLVRRYARQYPVPTYVVEFLLGRYCASVDEQEIQEGLEIVEKQLEGRTVRTSDQELFKSRARELGVVKLIDIVRARLDTKNDCYVAELPSLTLRDVQVEDGIVKVNERMLTDGFYAEVALE